MKRKDSELILFVKVFFILAVLGIAVPKILQLISGFFPIYDKKPEGGSCVYVMFNYGIKKNAFSIYKMLGMYIFSK
jgi:hypothetical protein